ncbi:MAG: hypothetical protein R3C03_23690 [Pirellulaceae bacterium]
MSIFNFLQQPWIDATNWRGEQRSAGRRQSKSVGRQSNVERSKGTTNFDERDQTAKQRLADPFQLIRDQPQTSAPMPLPGVM